MLLTTKMRDVMVSNHVVATGTHFFNRQLDFPFEPGVANEILENEPKSCLMVA